MTQFGGQMTCSREPQLSQWGNSSTNPLHLQHTNCCLCVSWCKPLLLSRSHLVVKILVADLKLKCKPIRWVNLHSNQFYKTLDFRAEMLIRANGTWNCFITFKEALGALTVARFLIPLDSIDAEIILCCSGILCHVGLNCSQPTLI